MVRWILGLVAIGMMQAASAAPASARETIPHSSFATITGHTSVPYGWVDFCSRYTGECDGAPVTPRDIVLTGAAWQLITKINIGVNRSVTPMTDMDHWGVVDRWDYPTDGKGDCEDYVLLKRKLLIEAGLPRGALLVTVVRDHQNEGHAVLTVKTDGGEYVLDNMVDKVVPWVETGYRFVKRQSQADQNVWDSISPTVAPPLAISSAR